MGGLGYLSVLSGLVVAIVSARIAVSTVSIARDISASGQHHRGHIHAARLTLLLVVLLLIDTAANWAFVATAGWQRSGLWPVVALPLLGGLYFYAATLALPTGLDTCTQLNGWFWITRRPVLIALLIADMIWFSLSELATQPTMNAKDTLSPIKNPRISASRTSLAQPVRRSQERVIWSIAARTPSPHERGPLERKRLSRTARVMYCWNLGGVCAVTANLA